jgi:putative hemin transport protein
MRIRDAARELGTTEVQLLATRCAGDGVTRLGGDMRAFFGRLPELGEVMALTRNEAAVSEVTGRYVAPSFNGHVGLVLGEAIDLRLFPGTWRSLFAVVDETDAGPRRSFQLFGATGVALHKVYVRSDAGSAVFDGLVEQFADENQSRAEVVEAAPARSAGTADAEVDVDAFRRGWLDMQDTHDFFPLMVKHRLTRTQALRLAPAGHATEMPVTGMRSMLEAARDRAVPIMVFVSSGGVIQIFSGEVHRTAARGPWFNVLDPGFNLHVREDLIVSTWLVRKPTADGVVTSLEVYDDEGREIALFFGKRKPGEPELRSWRELLDALGG